MLFVPGDDDRKMNRAQESGADAVILDLEDSVAPDRKSVARHKVCDYLRGPRQAKVYVRINALSEVEAAEDLAAVVARTPPDGIMLPKCSSPTQIRDLDQMLRVLEAREGLSAGSVRILPIVIETAESIFRLGGYRKLSARLSGLMWGVEDLAVDLASEVEDDAGCYLPAIELGRSLCLYAAAAAGVPAVDAAYANFRDLEGLASNAAAARRSGFSTKVAIHPNQVPGINAAFTPGEKQLDWARKVVETFDAAGGHGAVALDGRMLDRPHLKAARMIMERAAFAASSATR
jgi:citrate lyase subunit beta/citryl-CoA lyase